MKRRNKQLEYFSPAQACTIAQIVPFGGKVRACENHSEDEPTQHSLRSEMFMQENPSIYL
jgi:hypothetical protein